MKAFTQRDLDLIRHKVVKDCRRARRAGFRVVRFEFWRPANGRAKPRCCPITAVALAAGKEFPIRDSDRAVSAAARRLGITVRQAWSLIGGVDDVVFARPRTAAGKKLRELGQRVRKELRL